MKSKKIVPTETEPLLISALPARPNQNNVSGGLAYTSKELRAAFDKLPLLLVERYNNLIDDIESGEISDAISTGVANKTLSELFSDIREGVWSSYFKIGDTSLSAIIYDIVSRLEALEEEKA